MAESFVVSARFLAYRWHLSTNPDVPREEAWEFAQDHWPEFLGHSNNPDEHQRGIKAGPEPVKWRDR